MWKRKRWPSVFRALKPSNASSHLILESILALQVESVMNVVLVAFVIATQHDNLECNLQFNVCKIASHIVRIANLEAEHVLDNVQRFIASECGQ